jgi:ACS family hexuronate transporter-like MFS transporter
MGAGVGAILFTQTTGFVVDHFSYTPILIAAGLLPLAGTALLFALGGQVKRVA